jgi:hypothetical protein
VIPSSTRAWFDAVSWHVRGVFATEANRRFGYRMRDLWQPAEVEARRGLGRDLAVELVPDLRIARESGHRMLSHSAVPPLDEVCAIGRSIIAEARGDGGELAAGKQFSRFRIASDDERAALLRVALDPRMLAMASAYLGTFPVVVEADYYCSFATDGPFTKSQLWHCDDDAGDVIKVFIYCDDVDEADGPFELVMPIASRRIRDQIGYRYAGPRYRVSDAVMERHATADEQVSIRGPAGTAFVVDTSKCFHRGSRITDTRRRRIVATFCYCPPSSSILPRRLAGASTPLSRFAAQFDRPLQRAALGLPLTAKWL